MQVDNHMPDGLYPVLVSGRADPGEKGRDGRSGKAPTPFLQLSIIKEVNKSTNTAHFDYVAFRWATSFVGSCVVGRQHTGICRMHQHGVDKLLFVYKFAAKPPVAMPIFCLSPQYSVARKALKIHAPMNK